MIGFGGVKWRGNYLPKLTCQLTCPTISTRQNLFPKRAIKFPKLMKKFIALALILAGVNSCADLTIDEKSRNNLKPIWSEYFQENMDDSRAINVFVATNRKAKTPAFGCGDEQFGVTLDSALRFGSCKINVPKNHAVGDMPFAKDHRLSSGEFFKILEANSLEQNDLIKILKSSRRTPLVFVHGFNVRFEEAVLRASQIAYDLKYQGPIVLFTWPAGGGDGFLEQNFLNKTYNNNSLSAKASVEQFKIFLTELQKNKIKINLMVHSMGHQVALPALKELSTPNAGKALINQLILNAPDYSVNDFREIVKNITKISDQTTLYCSHNDKAMIASKTFNKNDRLGACTLFDEIDVINVGAIDDPTLGLGHGYYSSRAVLADISQTLFGIDASRRIFIAKSESGGTEKYFLRK